MKKYIFGINLLAILLFISSCDDIVDADNNILKTKIEYQSVNQDQEKSVIMPLKVGNIWVYKVTELNDDGSTKSMWYDTTYVIKDTIINSEKWFLTADPNYSFNTEKVCLTNTDVGLYVNDMKCFCYSLRAEYPAKHSSYLFSEEEDREVKVRSYSDDGKLIEEKTVNIRSSIVVDVAKHLSYQSSYGIYDCYSYNLRFEAIVDGQIAELSKPIVTNEYFVPDLGLIRKEYSAYNNEEIMKIFKISELIYTNVK
ncbi:MAG: hypothetical protein WCR42_04935 [bacterium]